MREVTKTIHCNDGKLLVTFFVDAGPRGPVQMVRLSFTHRRAIRRWFGIEFAEERTLTTQSFFEQFGVLLDDAVNGGW